MFFGYRSKQKYGRQLYIRTRKLWASNNTNAQSHMHAHRMTKETRRTGMRLWHHNGRLTCTKLRLVLQAADGAAQIAAAHVHYRRWQNRDVRPPQTGVQIPAGNIQPRNHQLRKLPILLENFIFPTVRARNSLFRFVSKYWLTIRGEVGWLLRGGRKDQKKKKKTKQNGRSYDREIVLYFHLYVYWQFLLHALSNAYLLPGALPRYIYRPHHSYTSCLLGKRTLDSFPKPKKPTCVYVSFLVPTIHCRQHLEL